MAHACSFMFLDSPLELETPLAEPGGVFDANPGDIWSSLWRGLGLVDFPGPLLLFCFETGLGVSAFGTCSDREAISPICCEPWDAPDSFGVKPKSFASAFKSGSTKLIRALDAFRNCFTSSSPSGMSMVWDENRSFTILNSSSHCFCIVKCSSKMLFLA